MGTSCHSPMDRRPTSIGKRKKGKPTDEIKTLGQKGFHNGHGEAQAVRRGVSKGVEGSGRAGPVETLERPWIPLPVRAWGSKYREEVSKLTLWSLR
jgi:hypothetical protein